MDRTTNELVDRTSNDARTPRKPALLATLGRWCHDNRRRVSTIWVGAIVALVVLVGVVGGNFSSDFETPDSEGGNGFDLIDEYFGGQGSGTPGRVVFRTDGLITDPAMQAPMQGYSDELAAQDILDSALEQALDPSRSIESEEEHS